MKNIDRHESNRFRTMAVAALLVAAAFTQTVVAHDDHDHVSCMELSTSSGMFDQPIDEATQAAIRSLDTLGAARFQLQGSTWTSTRTHPTIAKGEPFFLTYSFVLDGTSIPASFWDTNQNPQASNLFAQMNAQFPGGMTAFRTKVREAFNQWEAVSNFRYVEVPDDGAAFTVANAGLVPTATQIGRGDIRIAMRTIDGNGVDTDGNGSVDRNVLAYNQYPASGGDMVLDAGNMATWIDSSNDFRRLKNVILHENGHGLGMQHVMPQIGTKLMEPALNINFDGPQEDDIRAIAAMYGDPAESNNSLADAVPVGSIAAGQQTFTDYEMSLERAGAVDWYKFNATGGLEVEVTVTPVGTTYQQGAQATTANPNPPLNTVNAAAARDLRVAIFTQAGTQLDLANDTGAGQSETAVVNALPSTGTYFIRVDSTDNGTQPQRYALDLGANSEPEITVIAQTAQPQNLASGSTFNFGDTTVNSDRHFFFTIDNDGSDTLQLTNNPSIAIFGTHAGDFNVNLQPDDIDIDPGQSTAFNVGFRPSAAGLRTATVLISNNDEDESAFVFTVQGTGVGSSSGSTGSAEIKVFQVTPAFLFGKVEVVDGGFSDFPEVEVGSNLAVFYFIENHGDADLVINGPVDMLANTSGFSILSQINGFPIPAGNPEGFADNFRIRFAPVDTNTRTTRVFIYSNAVNTTGPFDFTVRGAGVENFDDCNTNDIDDADELAGNDCNNNGIPDECDSDSDGDSVPDDCDVCDGEDDLRDTDGDGLTDCLDECPTDPLKDEPGNCGCNNEESAECDNGVVLCTDGDDDGDGVCNSDDLCPGKDDLSDLDGDGIFDCLDADVVPEPNPGDEGGNDNTGGDNGGDTGGNNGNDNGGNNGGNNGNDNGGGNNGGGNNGGGNDNVGRPDGACGTGTGAGVIGAAAFGFGGSRRRRRRQTTR